MKGVKVFAPATIANFNVGYDVLGVSLNNIGDTLDIRYNGTSENRITEIVNGDSLPTDPDANCCTVVIKAIQDALGEYSGVDVKITKGFASGSGMGSSSASSAAAAYGYNYLIGQPFQDKGLVAYAALGEKVACGSAHVDNVAPAILGGIILATSSDPKEIIKLPIIDNMYAVTLFPDIKVRTSDSRRILKDAVDRKTYSTQLAYMASFVSSLYEGDVERFSASMHDLFVEPMRSLLIPHFDTVRKKALETGALGFGISGSGPSVFAITQGEDAARTVEDAMSKSYDGTGIEVLSYVNKLEDNSGARILDTYLT